MLEKLSNFCNCDDGIHEFTPEESLKRFCMDCKTVLQPDLPDNPIDNPFCPVCEEVKPKEKVCYVQTEEVWDYPNYNKMIGDKARHLGKVKFPCDADKNLTEEWKGIIERDHLTWKKQEREAIMRTW